MPDGRFVLLTLLAAGLAVGLFTVPAWGCPFCDGGATGVNEVKAEIFNDRFWLHAAAVLLPFPVLGGMVVGIYFGPKDWMRRRASHPRATP